MPEGDPDWGHMWHGKAVVEKLVSQQGEGGLLLLTRRFREAFVSSVQPRHLPPSWAVEHDAKR